MRYGNVNIEAANTQRMQSSESPVINFHSFNISDSRMMYPAHKPSEMHRVDDDIPQNVGERVTCDLCLLRRADIQLPCGHYLHVRCIFQLPLNDCPVCNADLREKEGLRILPVEPHEGSNNSEEEFTKDSELRIGRWHSYETLYIQHIIEDFNAGTLLIGEGTKLASLLSRLLNCNHTRLSKKLRIGKKYYAHIGPREATPEAIAAHKTRQRRISELEELFLMAEAQTARGASTTSILSEKLQTEWRERFVVYAHSVSQRLVDAWQWNLRKRRYSARSCSPVEGQSANEIAMSSISGPLFLMQASSEPGEKNLQFNVPLDYNYGVIHSNLYYDNIVGSNPMYSSRGGDDWCNDNNVNAIYNDLQQMNSLRNGPTIDLWTNLEKNLASLAYLNCATMIEMCPKRCKIDSEFGQMKAPLLLDATSSLNRISPLSSPPRSKLEDEYACIPGVEAFGIDPDSCENEFSQDFIGDFLDQVPFEAVDVWVPLAEKGYGSSVILFHAGFFTKCKELEEWGEYSNKFSFESGEGLPGRVFSSHASEWQENVLTLGQNLFLRLNGAIKTGIRTTFGVPVVSSRGVTFVIVFYSRALVQVNPLLREFIEQTVGGWKFDATYE